MSDHLALRCTFDIYVDYLLPNDRVDCSHCMWPKACKSGIINYQNILNNVLSTIPVNKELLLQ